MSYAPKRERTLQSLSLALGSPIAACILPDTAQTKPCDVARFGWYSRLQMDMGRGCSSSISNRGYPWVELQGHITQSQRESNRYTEYTQHADLLNLTAPLPPSCIQLLLMNFSLLKCLTINDLSITLELACFPVAAFLPDWLLGKIGRI